MSLNSKQASKRIFQLKIILQDTRPKTWRRIQVPANFTFAQLNLAILYAMDWNQEKFHSFEVNNAKNRTRDVIGIPNKVYDWNFYGPQIGDENQVPIHRYLSLENRTAIYVCEFEDAESWEVKIILEKILPREKNVKYPRCTAGKCATPSEILGIVCALQEFDPDVVFTTFPY